LKTIKEYISKINKSTFVGSDVSITDTGVPFLCSRLQKNAIFFDFIDFKKAYSLIITDAYYEWSALKKLYLVFFQNKETPFVFAGIFDRWQNSETGKITTNFAVVTTTAIGLP